MARLADQSMISRFVLVLNLDSGFFAPQQKGSTRWRAAIHGLKDSQKVLIPT